MAYCNCPHEVRAGCTDPNCPTYMPRMIRHRIDGYDVLLPSDAKLKERINLSDALGECTRTSPLENGETK